MLFAQFAADAKQVNWDKNYIALANSKKSTNEFCRCSIKVRILNLADKLEPICRFFLVRTVVFFLYRGLVNKILQLKR